MSKQVLEMITDLGMRYATNKSCRKMRFWLVRCPMCEKKFEIQAGNVKSGNTSSCKSCAHTKHGFAYHKLYFVWAAMIKRCENPEDKYFKDYGGRQISVCKSWQNSVEIFANWALANGWNSKLTIERVNNNGNYNEDNCTFISQQQQSFNKRMHRNNKTGYRGVSKAGGKYIAQLVYDGKIIHSSPHDTPLEAATARELFIISRNLPHQKNNLTLG